MIKYNINYSSEYLIKEWAKRILKDTAQVFHSLRILKKEHY